MVSNSALKRNKFTPTFVSETDRFQNLYRFLSYFRISSKKSVDTTIQQMIKFDVLSASFIFLLTLFYSFKARYKKEIYSFLIGQNLPGITNLSQERFKETSQYVVSFQDQPFLKESQFYFNTGFAKYNLINFDQNEPIKLKRKQVFSNKNLIFNGPSRVRSTILDNYFANNRTIPNFYHVNHNNNFEKKGKFTSSISDKIKFFSKNKIEIIRPTDNCVAKMHFCTVTNVSNADLLSPYDLAFQSSAAQNFRLSIMKKLEREGTNFKSLELPLNYNSYFGVFQKKDVTTKSGQVKQNIFKFPQRKDYILQNKLYDKGQPLADPFSRSKVGNQNWAEIYKQNKVIAKKSFQKSQKNWFYLGQNEALQTQSVVDDLPQSQWFSLYKNNLSKMYCEKLEGEKVFLRKTKTQPILVNKFSSIFYNVNNLSKSLFLQSPYQRYKNTASNLPPVGAQISYKSDLTKLSHFVKQNLSSIKTDSSKRQPETNAVKGNGVSSKKEKTTFTSTNWWHLIFDGNFGLNSNFIFENVDFPFSYCIKTSLFTKQKQEAFLAKNKTKFSYKKFRLDSKWKEKIYQHYLQLDEFPLKLGSIVACGNCANTMPPKILINQFSAKTKDILIKNVVETKSEIPNSLQKKGKSFAIKRKFILRGSKFVLNSPQLGFTEENSVNLPNKFTTSPHFRLSDNFAFGDLNPKFKQQEKPLTVLSDAGVEVGTTSRAPVRGVSGTPLSSKLSLLKNEIKALFSFSKNHSYFIEREKETFNLLSNGGFATLDKILLNNSLDTLLDQKKSSTNQNVLRNIGENGEILFYKNSVKHNIKDASLSTQEDVDLVAPDGAKIKEKGNLKSKYVKTLRENAKVASPELTQLLQSFWSQKEEISSQDISGKLIVEKTKDNWFPSFMSYLSMQPRLMSGYQFPDLNEKEINKLIKYSNSKKNLTNKIQFGRKVPFFVKNLRKTIVYRFQNPCKQFATQTALQKCIFAQPSSEAERSNFLQISKKENCQQHPVDVYLPTNFIQRFPQSKHTSLQKNLFLKKNTDLVELNKTLQEGAVHTRESGFASKMQNQFKVYQIKLDKNFVLQNKISDINFDKANPYFKPLKFISKSLRLENSTEKQSFFVSQIPALLKIPSIWNPKLQKLQIAKTMVAEPQLREAPINKSKYTEPSLDSSRNILSSTNFLTDRKQHFFAIGNQVEKEQKNFLVQRPFFGVFFGLSNNQEKCLGEKTQIDKNLLGKPLFKAELQNKGEQSKNFALQESTGTAHTCESGFANKLQNDFRKKDFSILPLFSKVNVKEKDYFTNQPNFTPEHARERGFALQNVKPSLQTESNLFFSEKNSKGGLQAPTGAANAFDAKMHFGKGDTGSAVNKTSRTLLKSSYKTCPKPIKLITGGNFYSFFDISAFNSPKAANSQIKSHETFLDFTQNNDNFERFPLTKQIVENSKLNVKRKQLSEKCDKQINTLHSVLPLLETDTFATIWTKWLSSRYKKPAIPYRFQKKAFYLPSNKKVDFFLQQKNRYQENKWGEIEQQEDRNKKGESANFSEQVFLPITIKRSIHFPNTSKVLPSKNVKFSFFTTKPLFSQNNNKNLKLIPKSILAPASNLENKKLLREKVLHFATQITDTNVKQSVESQNKESKVFFKAPDARKHFGEEGNFNKLSLFSDNFQKRGNTFILPYKRLSFVSKNVWQEQNTTDTLFWQKTIKKNPSFLYGLQEGVNREIAPLSHFLSDTAQRRQSSLSYLKRLDTNCDRLDWQFSQWHPFSHEKYTYLPPSQSTTNDKFLNSFFKNKLKKRNTIYRYNKHLPILKFHYVKSKHFKNFPFNETRAQHAELLRAPLPEVKPNTFRRTYSLSHLQNKQSFSNLLFPKKKRVSICWEPITIRSWMVITQYCYAFFLIQSALYVYEKHMKKVLLSFAPLLSGRGILSGMPSFGEKLQDFLGGSTIDKNVLLFRKVPKRFQDIVAIDNKLPQLSEIVWFLRNFGRTANINKIQGVLFVGPPGTGKTLLVQAIAGEAEVPVLVLSGSSFADGKKGKKGGQLLKRVFQRARILAPSILFIDEIDTLGESRSQFAQDERDQKNESSRIIESISYTEKETQDKTSFSQSKKNKSVKQVGLLTQFLVEMDGLARQQRNSSFFNNRITFGKPGGILVIGSTNRPKVLDPALTRPGRFDQVFYLSNPGKQKRIEILKVYTKSVGVSSFLPWDYLGDRTLGFSAADLSALVNKSTIRAVLSHTIHTIQSIEEGIESLPKFSQNQNKSFILREENISTYFLSLESKKCNNKNTILCKSIFTSLLICTKHLFLQNKYKSFNFSTDQDTIYSNSTFKFLQKKSTEPQLEILSGVTLEQSKNPLQQSINSDEATIARTRAQHAELRRAKPTGGSANDFNLQKSKSHTEFDHSLGIGISFLSRLSFYQAGKVIIQVLVSKDRLARQLSQGPITLVATLWPKQELSFSNMFEELSHVKEVINRNQLETRLINGYAGKAAETLLVSGLQFYKNKSNKTTVTWQSTLGVEEWKLTNSLACLMISKYHFYSQKSITQKENLISLSQNSNEILETENFNVLENIFSKEELRFSREKQNSQLPESKNDAFNTIIENRSFLNPIIWVSNLYQQYEITKIFGHIEENNWYQVYLPPLVKDEQNKEWVPLDQYYFGRENLIELVWNTSKNKSINWNEVYQINYDFTYQGLVLYHFNKALSLLDQNRELLDLFANLLLSFQTIRRHEILRILSYFRYHNYCFTHNCP